MDKFSLCFCSHISFLKLMIDAEFEDVSCFETTGHSI